MTRPDPNKVPPGHALSPAMWRKVQWACWPVLKAMIEREDREARR
jgi:hypothetical protein